MNAVRLLLILILDVFLLLLLARLALDWIQMFARDWRPRGVLLVIAEGLYTVTDPPLRAVRKVVPPLNLGGVALDLSFMVVVLIIWLLRVLVLR